MIPPSSKGHEPMDYDTTVARNIVPVYEYLFQNPDTDDFILKEFPPSLSQRRESTVEKTKEILSG